MNVIIARSLDQLPAVAAHWPGLVRSDPRATVFQTWEWTEAWWETFGSAGRLRLVLALEGDRLVGLAPLMTRPEGSGDRLVFIGDGHADYMDIVAMPPLRAPVIDAMTEALQEEPGWSSLRLRNIPADSPSLSLLADGCRRMNWGLLRDSDEVCPVLVSGAPPTSAELLLRKYRVRRPARTLGRLGQLEVIDLVTQEDALAHLPSFFDQHVRRWQGTRTPSLFHDPRNRGFYTRLVEKLLPTGHLLFSVALLDGRPIAYHFGFDYGGRVLWYKPAFEPALARRSPGGVLTEHLLHHVVRNQRRELDFTLGAEPFKQRYTNVVRYNANLRVYRHTRHYLAARAIDRGYRSLRWTIRRLGLAALANRYLRR